jgi:hypothetical protein
LIFWSFFFKFSFSESISDVALIHLSFSLFLFGRGSLFWSFTKHFEHYSAFNILQWMDLNRVLWSSCFQFSYGLWVCSYVTTLIRLTILLFPSRCPNSSWLASGDHNTSQFPESFTPHQYQPKFHLDKSRNFLPRHPT